VGDSVTNVITPLNPYVVIILTFMQRYVPRAGIGTLVALMLPYAIAFGIVWSAMLALWVALGVPLGPSGPLFYGAH
jgi:aminobenzoyl-glutamate transport protein